MGHDPTSMGVTGGSWEVATESSSLRLLGARQSKLCWVTVFVTSGGVLVQRACRVSGSGISRQGSEVCVKGRKVEATWVRLSPYLTSVQPEQLLVPV